MSVYGDPIILRRFPQISKRYLLSRSELREFARKRGIRRGRNTDDTVNNLKAAGLLIGLNVFKPRLSRE
jgi:hypothetical protein